MLVAAAKTKRRLAFTNLAEFDVPTGWTIEVVVEQMAKTKIEEAPAADKKDEEAPAEAPGPATSPTTFNTKYSSRVDRARAGNRRRSSADNLLSSSSPSSPNVPETPLTPRGKV